MPPLPTRVGDRPRTTPTNPHTQLDQQPTDLRWFEELAQRVFALPGVIEEPSRISVPGANLTATTFNSEGADATLKSPPASLPVSRTARRPRSAPPLRRADPAPRDAQVNRAAEVA